MARHTTEADFPLFDGAVGESLPFLGWRCAPHRSRRAGSQSVRNRRKLPSSAAIMSAWRSRAPARVLDASTNPGALALEGDAQSLLRGAEAVALRGVEKGDPAVERVARQRWVG